MKAVSCANYWFPLLLQVLLQAKLIRLLFGRVAGARVLLPRHDALDGISPSLYQQWRTKIIFEQINKYIYLHLEIMFRVIQITIC